MADYYDALKTLIIEVIQKLNDENQDRIKLRLAEHGKKEFIVTRSPKENGINVVYAGLYFTEKQNHPSAFSVWNGEQSFTNSEQIGDIAYKNEAYKLNPYTTLPDSNDDTEWLLFSKQIYTKENEGKDKCSALDKDKIKSIILTHLP